MTDTVEKSQRFDGRGPNLRFFADRLIHCSHQGAITLLSGLTPRATNGQARYAVDNFVVVAARFELRGS